MTIPPLSWINLAHKNGVPILGLFRFANKRKFSKRLRSTEKIRAVKRKRLNCTFKPFITCTTKHPQFTGRYSTRLFSKSLYFLSISISRRDIYNRVDGGKNHLRHGTGRRNRLGIVRRYLGGHLHVVQTRRLAVEHRERSRATRTAPEVRGSLDEQVARTKSRRARDLVRQRDVAGEVDVAERTERF